VHGENVERDMAMGHLNNAVFLLSLKSFC